MAYCADMHSTSDSSRVHGIDKYKPSGNLSPEGRTPQIFADLQELCILQRCQPSRFRRILLRRMTYSTVLRQLNICYGFKRQTPDIYF